MIKTFFKLRIFFLFFVFSGPTYGQSIFQNTPIIDDDVIERIVSLFYRENYKECIDSCEYYIRYNYNIGYEKHPYRDWGRSLVKSYGIEDLSKILYFGALSAYKYSLIDFDSKSISKGIMWAIACANICVDYFHEVTPKNYWSAERMERYILYGEMGLESTQYGVHLLHVMGNERWAEKEIKRLGKIRKNIYETMAKELSGFESKFSEYPLLQYKITNICSAPSVNKSILKDYPNIFSKRLSALKNLIEHNEDNIFDADIHIALNALTSMLTNTVIEGKVYKRIGGNYGRFCMENLIKLQDLSYYLSGSSRYSKDPSYTLQDIQNCLEDTDCAIIHFEAPVASGNHYYRYDLGTMYRNYALIITKNQETPYLWHRGYIKDDIINDLSKIKETYPNAKRFFYVGTPRMSAFIDIAGTDASIVRLHSLSQLLQKHSPNEALNEITFIGDINYQKIGEIREIPTNLKNGEDSTFSQKKGTDFRELKGPSIELKYLKALNKWNVRTLRGDDATRNVVASEIARSKNIVHISTHGDQTDYQADLSVQDLSIKKDFMESSRLILSGYIDTPNSKLSYISAKNILELKKIDAQIVFLDACFAGRGKVSTNGAVGFAESFHLIGAKNIICYLEPIDDDIATEFSNKFYQELANGASCHDAFFIAKKSLNTTIKVVLWE